MLIPLGVLAASGSAGILAYDLIATGTGTGTNSVISFTSIPQDYRHLQVRWSAKNTQSGAQNGNINFTINNVSSGSTYTGHRLFGSGTTVQYQGQGTSTGANDFLLQESVSLNTTANAFSAGILDLFNYTDTSRNKTIRAHYGRADGTDIINFVVGTSSNTSSAVTSLTFTARLDNFAAGTRFSLYGIRG